MHEWDDEDDKFDRKGLKEALEYIVMCFKAARIPVIQSKIKWGSLRIYMGGLGWRNIHTFLYPGYCACQWRKWYNRWLWAFDCHYGHYIMYPINLIVVPWHERVYRRTYELAVKAHPHLTDEILTHADYQELVEGINGYKHSKHWDYVGSNNEKS